MAIWDNFLTEDDKKVLARRKPRAKTGPGRNLALVVIDMQVTACGDDRPIWEQLDTYSGACGPHAWRSIPVQNKMIDAARAVGMPIVWTKHIFHPHMGWREQSAKGHNFSSLDPKSDLPEGMKIEAGDILVEKQTASAFAFTNFPIILAHLGVDGLLLMGNSTSGCVRATAVDGKAAGFAISVIEECVFDRIEASHALSLFDMQFKYCDVISADDALGVIASRSKTEKVA